MADISQIKLPSGDTFDLVDEKSGYITGMTILSYGSSTWSDFIEAYNAKKVVYCRASSNTNPASGSQTRLAFMAYVSDADNPTNVEFQYYRSVSSHTASQQGDQVYVYKLDKTAGWTATTREAAVKININANHDGIETTYSNGTVSIGHANSVTAQTTQAVYPIAYDAQGHITGSGTAVTIPTITLNGSTTTTSSFYAPITAGTSGQILTSSENGAPTWVAAPAAGTQVQIVRW